MVPVDPELTRSNRRDPAPPPSVLGAATGTAPDPGLDTREAESAAAFAARSPPSERRLLSFYDRLRTRILKRVEKKGGKLGRATAQTLLLVPDIFVLLVRLSLDKEVPAATRTLMAGALAYFLLPVDLLPEAVLGVGGYLEDAILAAAVLSHAFDDESAAFAEKHWSGRQELRGVLRDVSHSASSLLGENLFARVKRVMAKRGVKIQE